jgi:hypothetical protein
MAVKSMNMMLRIAVAAFGFLLPCACAVPPEPQIMSLMDVPPDKTVVVGRVELHPPLREEELTLKTERGEELKSAFILYCGDRLMDLKARIPASFSGSFATVLEKEFFIKTGKDMTLYVSGGTFYSVFDPPYRVLSHTFGSPFQVELRPDDEAVYIGTIQYYRDAANNLTSVMIRDDYQWADSQFKERFGTSKNLRKALLTPSTCCN